MQNPDLDVAWLVHLAREAGHLAYGFFGKASATLKADDSWVTEADLAVERFIREELRSSRPDDDIIGEEGDTTAVSSAPYVWAIDPIDGTRAFYHGFPVWGVSIGLLVEGMPYAGVFVLPALGDLYHTDGTTAFLNDVPLRPPNPPVDKNAVFLISEGAYQARTIDYPGKVLSLGSAAAHLCYVARGSAVGAMDQAGVWDYAAAAAHLCYVARGSAVGAMDQAGVWDYAAGAAILSTLGISARYVSGQAVAFTDMYDGRVVPEPTLFAPDAVFESLQRASRT